VQSHSCNILFLHNFCMQSRRVFLVQSRSQKSLILFNSRMRSRRAYIFDIEGASEKAPLYEDIARPESDCRGRNKMAVTTRAARQQGNQKMSDDNHRPEQLISRLQCYLRNAPSVRRGVMTISERRLDVPDGDPVDISMARHRNGEQRFYAMRRASDGRPHGAPHRR